MEDKLQGGDKPSPRKGKEAKPVSAAGKKGKKKQDKEEENAQALDLAAKKEARQLEKQVSLKTTQSLYLNTHPWSQKPYLLYFGASINLG